MPTPRQMVVNTLKDLSRQCLRRQNTLLKIKKARKQLLEAQRDEEKQLYSLRLRIDREINTYKNLLGIKEDPEDNDGELE